MPMFGFQDSQTLGIQLPQAHNEPFTSRNVERLVFHNTSPNRRASPNFADALQRKIRPLPTAKRIRVSDDFEHREQGLRKENQHYNAHSNHSAPPISLHLRPQATVRTISTALLNPCHICHRKPTKKSDLDSFADCEGCEQRTCYVCIRQCQGWLPHSSKPPPRQSDEDELEEPLSRSFTMHDVDDMDQKSMGQPNSIVGKKQHSNGTTGWTAKGHGSVICSRCCVERGSEGDVVCLGCLADMEGA